MDDTFIGPYGTVSGRNRDFYFQRGLYLAASTVHAIQTTGTSTNPITIKTLKLARMLKVNQISAAKTRP